MKLFDATYDGEKITIHREWEEHLTRDQRYNILLALIICPTICFVVSTFFGVF